MKEVEFAYRVRQALNEGAEQLDDSTLRRLELARLAALAKRKPDVAPALRPAVALRPAGGGPVEQERSSLWDWMFRVGIAAPAILLVVGFISVYQWRQSERIDELAAIDLALLLDDQPLSTYADRGFTTLLNKEHGL
jgi:hypothetical protein